MPTLVEQLQHIEHLRQAIEEHGKLSSDILKRIQYRFRLECNYYSNRQEGGTLTRDETRTVMTGIISVDKKPHKDINEMKGHDEVMQEIFRIGRGELIISEKRIQNIHKTIIYEEDPEKQKLIGKWKKEYNEIINWKGEKYGFTPPDEVPEQMHALINWLNAEQEKIKRRDKNAQHPVILAFDFHVRFLTIHPFHDGNGRTARLLSNLLLVANGYPPFFIKDEEKDTYNRYLADIQGYGGDPDLFYEFMAGLVARSMQLTLDVIEGKDEDPDDWVKKLRLIKTNLVSEKDVKTSRTEQALQEVLEKSILPLFELLFERLQVFDELFLKKDIQFGGDSQTMAISNWIEARSVFNKLMSENQFKFRIKLSYHLDGFNKAGFNTFFISFNLIWTLEDFKYIFRFENIESTKDKDFSIPKLYDQFYSQDELLEITNRCGNVLYQQIEKRLNPPPPNDITHLL